MVRERATATRASLLAAARELFTGAGYHATATADIVGRADVTRGALYHHFVDKEHLFIEIFRLVSAELVAKTNSAVASMIGSPWEKTIAGFSQYLELVAANDQYQRILLIDGPAVLGWARWRALQAEFIGGGTISALQMLMDDGIVTKHAAEPLASLIQASLNDVALTIAHSSRPSLASAEATAAFIFLLDGLRRRQRDPKHERA